MTAPVTMKFGAFVVQLGDGADPEVFSAPCGFKSKKYSTTKTVNTVEIPDCNDPDAIAWESADAKSIVANMEGEGVLDAAALQVWQDAVESTDPVNAKGILTFSSGAMTYAGAFHVESVEITGNLGERVTVAIKMRSDGAVTSTWA